MMRANVERIYDGYERKAVEALMRENAHRAKRPKAGDLFKRPVDELEAKNKTENLKEKADQATAWLSQFEQFSDIREEEANG